MKKRKLSPATKMRLKLWAEQKRKKAEEKEERLLARWLLFAKGRGQMKNLNVKDKNFVRMVKRKAYDRFMSDLILGTKTRLNQSGVFKVWTPSRPPSFHRYNLMWYGSAKGTYILYDVPRLMKMRMEMLRNGSTDTSLQECSGRYMQELQREIGERERRNVDIPVSDVQVHPSGVEGRDKRQKQVRGRSKKEEGRRREAATV